ncbi:chain-length determining protein [Anaerococcus sp.]|uniref:chain-length determining protein n=1 Tax=Anaerococcus sp. TaxID=1872515 RepID=UPI002A749698|nr:chain-length determining protein [Anaerococcus sp.]MDY2927257.1 chain-length determining protein [Anaerococcus sp.]
MKEKRSLFSAIPAGLICGILAAVIFYFALSYSGFNEYRAKSKIITTGIENVNENSGDASTYAATINSNKIKKTVLDNLGIDMSLGMLDAKLSIEPIEGSSVVDIVVTDTNKLRAEDIADEYADLAVRVIGNIYGTDAQVMEYSYQSAGRVNNGKTYATIVGLGVFVIASLIGMIRVNSFNNKVLLAKAQKAEANEEELEDYETYEDDYGKISSDSKREVKDGRVSFKKEEDYSSYAYNDNDDDNNDDRDFTGTQKIDPVDFEEEDFGETTIIDQDEILYGINRQNRSNKDTTKNDYPIIGKLAPYSKGELDV